MKKSIVISSHVVFWVIIAALKLLTILYMRHLEHSDFLIYSSIRFFSPVVAFYIGYFGIMHVLKNKQTSILLLVGTVLIYFCLYMISKRTFAIAMVPVSTICLWGSIGGLFRFFIDWFKKRNENFTLEKQYLRSELALLRAQISPHFLFNTLHNIDTLINEDQKKASQSLIKLSDIMRYMLQENKVEKVDIEKEMNYIGNYISLEKLRLKNEMFINYSVEGEYSGKKIVPMLFIPFIENAFKHSIDSDTENGITIHFVFHDNGLIFTCENSFDPSGAEKDETSGIGLDTVRKRLSLLYPKSHRLEINESQKVFKVKLEITTYEN